MAKRHDTTTDNTPIEQYEHKGQQRKNNPPVGLVDAESDAVEGKEAVHNNVNNYGAGVLPDGEARVRRIFACIFNE